MKPYFAFQWHITDECDQRCKHCYIFSEGNCKELKSMCLEDMKKVLESCQDMCDKLGRQPYFYITGGDPVLHPDFWNLLEILKEKKIPFSIMGNPFHIDYAVCKRLKEYGCEKYQMSLDGLEETHDYFRKPGSFQCTLEKIKVLRDAGIKCAIMSTVSGRNLHEIESLVDLVVEYKVDIFAFGRYCPTSEEKETGIAPLEYRQFLHKLWKKYQTYEKQGVATYFNLKDHLWNLYLYEEGIYKIPETAEKNKIYDGCHCAACHMTILPNGDIYACRRFESNVGNVFEESLTNIFLEKEEKYRDFNKFIKCSKCELKGFCRGCPAVAYGTTGDFYGADPQCWKEIV